ncbi:MAG: hypothetical protein Ct9H300mP11_11030 [Chloroflexota bacterium]|nr:MAG: hypothetical protein Ct9H300mP11_11030 [Chloroflexota bacterium]
MQLFVVSVNTAKLIDESDLEELLKIIAVVIATTAGFTIAGAAGFGGGVVAYLCSSGYSVYGRQYQSLPSLRC